MNSESGGPLVVDARLWSELAAWTPVELEASYGGTRQVECTADVLEARNFRAVLQRIDWLLADGGTCSFNCGTLAGRAGLSRRNHNQIQYAVSLLFRECWVLRRREGAVLVFEKRQCRRRYGSRIRDLTVGIVSDGSQIEQIRSILEYLRGIRTFPVEVLICGPVDKLAPLHGEFSDLRILPDVIHEDLRAPINRKKARLIEEARGENLALIHDRFFLDSAWAERLAAHGNQFDFYNCRHCDIAAYPEEHRVAGDWGYCGYPLTGFSHEPISDVRGYDEACPLFYIAGGMYLGKTAVFREVGWPVHLHWGDMEDVHFTRQLELAGFVVQHDWGNRVFTTTKRMPRIPKLPWRTRLRLRILAELARLRFLRKYRVPAVD